MSFEDAARRRDLTINAMGVDVATEELLDPLQGEADLARKVLRAADPSHFAEDPLRGLRVAQFAARFEMTPDDELVALCAALDLSELSPERIFAELNKALLLSRKPSIAFSFLERTKLLRFFPELDAMRDVPQEPEWHPEGDVFTHTLMVIDEAAKLRAEDEQDLALMYGALCHDIGKPPCTEIVDGRVRSFRHDEAGAEIAGRFLERLRAPSVLIGRVMALVRHHLKPGQLDQGDAKPSAYRRLARQLEGAHVTMELLHRLALADYMGRTTEDALARRYPAGDTFNRAISNLALEDEAPRDVVLGRHLIARGLEPGPRFGEILEACREVQDETGWDDPERILQRVLGSAPGEEHK
jgi:tRNA nucleotidyltransferase (CCA-adding enzyme)